MTQLSGEEYRAMQAQKKKPSANKSMMLIPLVVGVIALAGGFLGGVQYQKGHASSTAASNGQTSQNPGGFQGGGPGRMGMRGSFGTVTAISPTSITVQNSRTNAENSFEIASDTTVTNSGQTAQASDIKVGDSVVIRPSTSNAKQAAQINLNPQLPGGPPSQVQTN